MKSASEKRELVPIQKVKEARTVNQIKKIVVYGKQLINDFDSFVKNWKMAAKQNSMVPEDQAVSDDIPLASLEESLFSSEKLDRASPELWPEQIPGVSEFAPLPNCDPSPPSWDRGLTKEDFNVIQQLGSLSTSGLIMEVKKLHDLAYQLGLEEAKEMTRGKYLNIFQSRRHR